MSRQTDLDIARDLAKRGEMDQAYVIADRYLKDDPNDVLFLTIMVYVMLDSDKTTVAYHLAKRVSDLAPKDPAVWVNFGMACQDLWRSKEAERAYKKGIALVKKDQDQYSMLLVNLCALYIDIGLFDKAEPYAKQVLEVKPEHAKSIANLGFCQLAQRNWEEGWKNYRHCLGMSWRPQQRYMGEDEWEGQEVDTLVLYAEQGLGDVISFASLAEYAQTQCKKLILDVDPCLKNLFQRSFPKAKVYGTRGHKKLAWEKEDHKVDASLSIGQVAEYCRNKDSDFPGTAFLTPDPDRVFMWKQLFKSKNKPVIGLAWRGGIPKTGAKYRQWDLEQLHPLLSSIDAHWVSLQYKPASREIAEYLKNHPEIDLVEYPHATLTKDYDDTAALVKALDHVVCMQTAVTHLCGAMEVPCWTHIPINSQWRYGSDGEDFVWAKSVRLIRQKKRGEWKEIIKKTAGELCVLFPRVSKATGKAAQNGKVRSSGREILRSNDKSNSGQGADRPPA